MTLLLQGVNLAVPLAECDGTMSNMTLLMPGVYLTALLATMVNMTLFMSGVNIAVQLAECDGTMANMTLLMPGVNTAVLLAECDGTMDNISLLMPGENWLHGWLNVTERWLI